MKGIKNLLCLLVLAPAMTLAQNPTPPNPDAPKTAEVAQWKRIDLKPSMGSLSKKFNNDSVAAGYSISGQFNRIVMMRFKYQTDLLAGIQKGIEKEGIKNAVILTGMGSLTSHHAHSVSNKIFPSKNKYYKANEPDDLVSITGFVIDGVVHAHIVFSNEVKAKGGHLEAGTKVFTFAGVAFGVLDDNTSLKHLDNKNWR